MSKDNSNPPYIQEENQEVTVSKRELRRKRRRKNQIISYVVTIFLLAIITTGIVFGVKKIEQYSEEKRVQQEQEELQLQLEEEASSQAQEQQSQEEETIQVQEQEDLLEDLISTYIKDMSIEDKVAGLFFVTPEAITDVETAIQAGDGTKEALNEYPVGGIAYFGKNIKSSDQFKTMVENTIMYSKYPLFVGIDEEGGTVARLADANIGIENVGPMGEIGATNDRQAANDVGQTIGTYLKDYGFNVNFAPVSDVLTVPENAIGDRTFGSEPQLVSEMVASFVEGMQETGVSATLKHFPGHGGTDADSHNGVAITKKTLEEMMETEFVPFKAGINAGAQFVMVGHISAPNVIGDEVPSVLSSMMVTEVLRNQLGYNGIVITDAMNMKAITDKYSSEEASVLALQAGVDMILMPEDFKQAYEGVLNAVEAGKITEERVDESLRRIYRVKYQDALNEN